QPHCGRRESHVAQTDVITLRPGAKSVWGNWRFMAYNVVPCGPPKPRTRAKMLPPSPKFRAFACRLDAWARLEKDYRRPIPMGVRERLEGVIIDYLRLDEMEQKAPPQTSARDEITATRKAVDALLQRLQSIQSAATDVHSFVRHLIAQRLKLETRW